MIRSSLVLCVLVGYLLTPTALSAEMQLSSCSISASHTTICESAAGPIMKLVLPGASLPETVHIVSGIQSPDDNAMYRVTYPNQTFMVYDLAHQGVDGPAYAVREN
ncbi:MAG TPA: hypothetical protein VKP88_04655 [Candidatus Paceibacterota bacterium]|nr:hypothetical protein [Candidatus Paceibacterota bacterium]